MPWPNAGSPKFRRDPFAGDLLFDPGRADMASLSGPVRVMNEHGKSDPAVVAALCRAQHSAAHADWRIMPNGLVFPEIHREWLVIG
jgi:hypothetical protein